MFRARNPTNSLLAGSLCVFDVQTPHSNDLAKRVAGSGLLPPGADIDSSHGNFRLSIPHQITDAFGGLFLLGQLGVSANPGQHSGTTNSQYSGFSCFHAWTSSRPRNSTRSFTQTFLYDFLQRFQALDSISIAVAMDDLSDLKQDNVIGNSLVVVDTTRVSLTELCELDRNAWLNALRSRARRTTAILERRHTARKPSPVLISSIGPLDRYPWTPKLDPSSLVMYPTPKDASSANLVMWSNRGRGGLTLIASPGHPLVYHWGDLQRLWSELHE